MPKKKNFLGGMQNYNPNNGEYEPDLKGPHGESPSGFKSFKKQSSEFNKSNDKRLGKAKEDYQKGKISKGELDDIAIKGSEEDKARIKSKEQKYLKDFPEDVDKLMELKEKFVGKDYETALDRLSQGEDFGDVLKGVVQYEQKESSEFDKANAKRMGKKLSKVEDWRISEALDDASWSVTQNTKVGKYAQEIADKLNIDKEDVLRIMSKEAGRELQEDEDLAKILFPEEENELENNFDAIMNDYIKDGYKNPMDVMEDINKTYYKGQLKQDSAEFEDLYPRVKAKFEPSNKIQVGQTVKIAKEFGDNTREFEVVKVEDKLKGITIKEKGRDGITYNVDKSQLEGYKPNNYSESKYGSHL